MEGSSVLSDSKLKMRGIDFGKKKKKNMDFPFSIRLKKEVFFFVFS
jgi:hypothetical protein